MRKKSNDTKENQIVPVFSPRSQYKLILQRDEALLSDLTLNFDKYTLGLMKKQFDHRQGQIGLTDFIKMCKEYMSNWQKDQPLREQKLTRCLLMLFNQIDIDGNGSLDWEQFTNYIIERAVSLKNIQSNLHQVKSFTMSPVFPKERLDAPICKAIFLQNSNEVVLLQEGKTRLLIMSIETGQLTARTLQPVFKGYSYSKTDFKDTVLRPKSRIYDIQYIYSKKYNMLLSSSSDNCVRGWKYSQGSFTLASQPDNDDQSFQHKFVAEISVTAWDDINQILYCGQKGGGLVYWSLKTDTESQLALQGKKNVQNNKQIKAAGQQKSVIQVGHLDMVTCIVAMPNIQFLASGSMDGRIIIWDTINDKKKLQYTEHNHGIQTLAFHQGLILLFSGGFDKKICVWNPYIQSLIHKIEVHTSAINCIRFVQNINQLVSLDAEGNVKLIQVRRFKLVAQFSLKASDEKHELNPTYFAVLNKPLRLLFCGNNVRTYEYNKAYNPKNADDNDIVACRFNQRLLSFFTASKNKLKIWSALTGHFYKIYADLSAQIISCFEFDLIQKRILIGDKEGNCHISNVLNGVRIKSLASHSGQIIFFRHVRTKQFLFVTAGLDNYIHISSDISYQMSELLRKIYVSPDVTISCVLTIDSMRQLIVGTVNGPIGVYDFQNGKILGSCYQKSQNDVSSLNQLPNYPFIIATYSTGRISLILTIPFNFKFKKIFTVNNYNPKTKEIIPIVMSVFCRRLDYLIIADETTTLKCLDFGSLLPQLNKVVISEGEVLEQLLTKIKPIILANDIEIIWQVVLYQPINYISLQNQESLLVLITKDRRIRLLQVQSGQIIESLRQSTSKDQLVPVGYMRGSQKRLYKNNLIDLIDKQIQNLDQYRIYFDPFYNYERIEIEKLVRSESNDNWKLKLDFRNHLKLKQEYIRKFIHIRAHVNEEMYFHQKKISVQGSTKQDMIIKHPYDLPSQYRLKKNFIKSPNELSEVKEITKIILPKIKKKKLSKMGFQPIKQIIENNKLKKKQSFQYLIQQSQQSTAIDRLSGVRKNCSMYFFPGRLNHLSKQQQQAAGRLNKIISSLDRTLNNKRKIQ